MAGRAAAVEVCGYVRVSTDEQANSGLSLDSQRDRIRGFAGFKGLPLIATFEDPGGSGKSLDRPGLQAALGWLSEVPGRGLVVAKLDRLSRSVRDWCRLLDGYFKPDAPARSFLFAASDSVDTSTAAGRLFLGFLFMVAEWERDTIVERTRSGLDVKRRRGELVGSVPYGYGLAADGRRLVPHPGERAAADLAARLRASGKSLREVGRGLTAAGLSPRGGGAWHAARVAELVRRAPALAAEISTDGEA